MKNVTAEYRKPKEMTLGEFLEWFHSEYENCPIKSQTYRRTIDLLHGYELAMKDNEAHFILSSALELLRGAENFFAQAEREQIYIVEEE